MTPKICPSSGTLTAIWAAIRTWDARIGMAPNQFIDEVAAPLFPALTPETMHALESQRRGDETLAETLVRIVKSPTEVAAG